VILPDSSAWIDYLRGRDTPARPALRAALGQNLAVVCEPVWAEVMLGARDERHLDRMGRMFAQLPMLPTAFSDWESAATIARLTRERGVTIRSFIDCLIAGIALRHDATVLHSDGDFERIASVFPMLDETRG